MTKSVIVSAAVTLTSVSTTITGSSSQQFNGSTIINYGTTAALAAADVFSHPSVAISLTNQATLSLAGSAVGVGANPNFAAGYAGNSPFALAAAVDLYGFGTFTNAGLVESSLIETMVAATATTVPLFESATDGVFLLSGTVVNQSLGTIEANGVAAYVGAQGNYHGVIENSGLIQGLQSTLKASDFNGTLTNSSTFIAFGYGVVIGPNASTASLASFVSLNNSGIIAGAVGVDAHGSARVVNSGTIRSDGPGVETGTSPYFNQSNGSAIYGKNIRLPTSPTGTFQYQPSDLMITNTGLISSDTAIGFGIDFEAGTVTNQGGATIFGYNGAIVDGFFQGFSGVSPAGGLVVNAGVIIGGVDAAANAVINNQAGGQISGGHGGVGVYLNGATLINSGTVSGTTDAVSFGGVGGTVIVGPSSVFLGSIASTGSVDVVEFSAPTAGASIALSRYFGGNLTFDFSSASSITVEGSVAQFASGAAIAGLTQGDTIQLSGFGGTIANFVSGVGLEVSNGTSTVTLDIQGNFTTSDFTVTDPPGVTTIAVNANPCFAAGVDLLTAQGPVAVESLKVGDQLVRVQGGVAPIVWIGRRRLNVARHPDPEAVNPILIEASAIADQVPMRDLYVSPDHAIALAGCLFPAKVLVNGFNIRQVQRAKITYYHVELADHTMIYANGCPVESYLDTGNRGAFDNGGGPITLHPDLAQTKREQAGCAPFVESGPIAERVRAGILARAHIAVTSDPGLTITPRADGAMVIASRTAIPGEITADPRDRRRLGVKIVGLQAGDRVIPLDHPALEAGWYELEADGRWTNGQAVVPAALVAGDPVRVQMGAGMDYPLDAPVAPAPAPAATRGRGRTKLGG